MTAATCRAKVKLETGKSPALSLQRRAAAAVRDDDGQGGRAEWALAVMDAFRADGAPDLSCRADRMAECSVTWGHYATRSGNGSLRPYTCDDRLCPACVAHRTRGVRATLERVMGGEKTTRFITLTQPVIPGEPATAGRERLLASWSRFWRAQKRAGDDAYIHGGMRRVEVTWSKRGGWHWHLHVLCQGVYLPHQVLVSLWTAAGGGFIVDIRRVRHQAGAAAELTKYVLKVAGLPPEKIVEYARATQGVRDVQTFGTWYRAEAEEVAGGEEEERAALVRPGDVYELAHGTRADAAREALMRCMQAIGGPPGGEMGTLARWREWARSVWRGWTADAMRAEGGARRRAEGRAKRADALFRPAGRPG